MKTSTASYTDDSYVLDLVRAVRRMVELEHPDCNEVSPCAWCAPVRSALAPFKGVTDGV